MCSKTLSKRLREIAEELEQASEAVDADSLEAMLRCKCGLTPTLDQIDLVREVMRALKDPPINTVQEQLIAKDNGFRRTDIVFAMKIVQEEMQTQSWRKRKREAAMLRALRKR